MLGTDLSVRAAAVAGTFYPAAPAALHELVAGYLREAETFGPYPKALIVPHAGYVYSGPVAASGYALLKPIRKQIHRVLLLGPSHRVPLFGLGASSCDAFATPLGTIPLDAKLIRAALRMPQVQICDESHRIEHSLEVQLPFLQTVLGEFTLAPFTVGQTTVEDVAEFLEHFWDGDDVLIVISSDLSHYHDYSTAKRIDSRTSHFIECCQVARITGDRACGHAGICGLLEVVKKRHLHISTIDLRNSGDTAGPATEVVGYGSFAVY